MCVRACVRSCVYLGVLISVTCVQQKFMIVLDMKISYLDPKQTYALSLHLNSLLLGLLSHVAYLQKRTRVYVCVCVCACVRVCMCACV